MNFGAARGWRRIGIVLSVLVFFPLGIFLWDQPSVNERVYRMSLESCYKLDVTKAREGACLNRARLDYERHQPAIHYYPPAHHRCHGPIGNRLLLAVRVGMPRRRSSDPSRLCRRPITARPDLFPIIEVSTGAS
jgi:hypothetical protein